MSTMAVESPTPAGLPTGVLGNPPATDVGAAAAFALAIQLALGVGGTRPTTPVVDGTAKPTDGKTDGKADGKKADDGGTTDVDGTGTPDAALAALVVPTPLVLPVAAAGAKDAATDKTVKVEAPSSGPHKGADTAPAEVPTTAVTTEAGTGSASTDQSQGSAPDTTTAPAPLAALPETAPVAPTQTAAQVNTVAPVVAPADAAGTPAPRPVVHQVIPEVTKLFSNGEGVHRVTLELNPKALGEVKVVLTVRNGDVHVRLAAGSEARAALASSHADLTRALEHIGVKDHRLTLAELPGVVASASTQTFSDTTEQQGQNASFTGRFDTEQHHDSRQPRMGDGSTATDGTDHDHGSRTRGDRSIHEVSHVPSRGGVDLRM